MKLSTQTLVLADTFGDFEAVKFLCELGYDSIDYSFFGSREKGLPLESDDFLNSLIEIKKLADSYGVTFNQTHAPFGSYIEGNDEYNDWVKPLIIKALEASSILGAKYVIVHPFVVSQNQKEVNIEFFKSLIPYAEKYNVKIAIENMFGWNAKTKTYFKCVCSDGTQLCDYIDTLNSDHIVACLDIGHCGLVGEDVSVMIRHLGKKRLKCLHVHDNDNKSDQHTLPFIGSIDFPNVIETLKDIEYEGELTLESDNFLRRFPNDLLKDASKLMFKTAQYINNL